jgi:hypothetical protein
MCLALIPGLIRIHNTGVRVISGSVVSASACCKTGLGMILGLALPHCKENLIYVFLFWELLGLGPNFHIHVSMSDLYIPRIGPHISCNRIGKSIVGIYQSFIDT